MLVNDFIIFSYISSCSRKSLDQQEHRQANQILLKQTASYGCELGPHQYSKTKQRKKNPED